MSHSKTLIIALVICLVAAYSFLLTDYMKQEKAQTAVTNQTSDTARALALLARPSEGMEKRLEQVDIANQAAMQSVMSNNINSTQIINSILESADTCNLKAIPLTTSQWEKQSVGTSTYRMLPIIFSIEGSIPNLKLFIQKLDDRGLFPSLAIEDLSINWNSRTDSNAAVLNESSSLSVKLTVAIINRLEAGK